MLSYLLLSSSSCLLALSSCLLVEGGRKRERQCESSLAGQTGGTDTHSGRQYMSTSALQPPNHTHNHTHINTTCTTRAHTHARTLAHIRDPPPSLPHPYSPILTADMSSHAAQRTPQPTTQMYSPTSPPPPQKNTPTPMHTGFSFHVY